VTVARLARLRGHPAVAGLSLQAAGASLDSPLIRTTIALSLGRAS